MLTKISFQIVIVGVIFACGFNLVQSRTESCSENGSRKCLASKLSKSLLHFAFKFYQATDKSGYNPAISPFSLGLTLAMVHAGANGETATELNHLLELQNFTDHSSVNKAFTRVIKTLYKSNNENLTLSMANRLFVSNVTTVSKAYTRIVRRHYRSHIVPVDFENNKLAVASKINRWVENQTNRKINNMVNANSFNQFTKMVIINAIYFKGTWVNKFDRFLTGKSNFKLNSQSTAIVDMMNARDYYYFAESSQLSCQMVALDYLGDRVTMYVLLPNEVDGLARLETNLTPNEFIYLKNSLELKEIFLHFPKFHSDHGMMSMIETLRRLGAHNAISQSADFSGIFSGDSSNIALTELNHRVYLNVDENGTEAAGVTEGRLYVLSAVKNVNVDHPFLYIVYDKVINAVLFMGRVTLPKTD